MPRTTSSYREERAVSKGYEPVHNILEKEERKDTYDPKTRKEQDKTMQTYEEWLSIHWKNEAPPGPGSSAPDLNILYNFARYYAMTSKGTIEKSPTVMSIVAVMERFFVGFKRKTGNVIPLSQTKRVIQYIKGTLVEEGIVTTARKAKHNFGRSEFLFYMNALWSHYTAYQKHPRETVNNSLLMGFFATSGARIGAILPKMKSGCFNGITYKDIVLVLIGESGSTDWSVSYSLAQWYRKNHKDQKNPNDCIANEFKSPLLDDSQFLIACALADKAFANIDSVEDFFALRIPAGKNQLELAWAPHAQALPVVRSTKSGIVTDQAWSASCFDRAFKANLHHAGFCGASTQATVHAIRRGVACEIDKICTEAQRSQHIGHSDPKVYGQSYVAHMSSVDGKGAFLGEVQRRIGIEYFQSFEQFREDGMPVKLPARIKAEIETSVELRRCDPKKRSQVRTAMRKRALPEYQKSWLDKRRQEQVSYSVTEKEVPYDIKQRNRLRLEEDLDTMYGHLFPEYRDLTRALVGLMPVSRAERRSIIKQLVTAITRDYSTVYLPRETPVDGKCTRKTCAMSLEGLPPHKRSLHVHNCHRIEFAMAEDCPVQDVKYCYLCFTMCTEERWDYHCKEHVEQGIQVHHCGTISFGSSVLRPAYCPFCLGNAGLKAEARFFTRLRNDKLSEHLESHFRDFHWPGRCPVPTCQHDLLCSQDLCDQFEDAHGLPVQVPSSLWAETKPLQFVPVAPSKKRKRDPEQMCPEQSVNIIDNQLTVVDCIATVCPADLDRDSDCEGRSCSLASRLDTPTGTVRGISQQCLHLDNYAPHYQARKYHEINDDALDVTPLEAQGHARQDYGTDESSDHLRDAEELDFSKYIRDLTPSDTDIPTEPQNAQLRLEAANPLSATNESYSPPPLPKRIRLFVKQPQTVLKLRFSQQSKASVELPSRGARTYDRINKCTSKKRTRQHKSIIKTKRGKF